MYDFETDPEFQRKLDWAAKFVTEEVEPLDLVFPNAYDRSDEAAMAVARPLMKRVREAGLWACHLTPDLGGQGYGQVKLALLNEILGSSGWAPVVFGCQAPDSGNAEILAHFGTPEQKARYLEPLLAGDVVSCYAMTEPQAGSDPRLFTARARRDGDEWVLSGEKWFGTNAGEAAFFVIMVVTDPDVPIYSGASMFVVPAGTPGLEIIRKVGALGEPAGIGHGYLRFNDLRVGGDALLGGEGQAFAIAQTRLGGGRIHHAMRTLGSARKAFDMMCERAVSRRTSVGTLADYGVTQAKIAQCWIEIEQFRLLVLRTAWLIDKHNDYKVVRKDISAVKAAMPGVLRNVAQAALHLHGALGSSDEMPFTGMLLDAERMGLVDGPTEVHEVTLAKQLLKGYKPAPDVFPSGHLPRLRAAAFAKLGVDPDA
ncbi:acyl-CoA dehydrogenase family protein [Nocardia asteroides]|uniref:acyl-CoA dehydrogenase family protein n=1 Tax=Nocardia asteroides TaxID=1824 RepID=UPI0037CB129A